jgi:hypothetical protein
VVDVFEEITGFIEAARTEIYGQHHLSADAVAPVGEFMNADLVAIGRMPGEIKPRRAILLRANAVLPVIRRDEIAAGIADDRNLQLLDQFDDILAHAVFIGGGMIRFVDAGIDGAPQMLEKRAIEAFIDLRNHIVPVCDNGSLHGVSSLHHHRL